MEALEQERIARLETRVEIIKEDVSEVKSDIKELHSRITTGNREIVDKMDDMQSRIEHKMNAQAETSKAQHKEIQDEIKRDLNQIDSRVSSLEQWKWYVIGGAVVVGFLLATVVDLSQLFNIQVK
jgi:predicted  nucleic acid-binding Zn-ribbon protein